MCCLLLCCSFFGQIAGGFKSRIGSSISGHDGSEQTIELRGKRSYLRIWWSNSCKNEMLCYLLRFLVCLCKSCYSFCSREYLNLLTVLLKHLIHFGAYYKELLLSYLIELGNFILLPFIIDWKIGTDWRISLLLPNKKHWLGQKCQMTTSRHIPKRSNTAMQATNEAFENNLSGKFVFLPQLLRFFFFYLSRITQASAGYLSQALI